MNKTMRFWVLQRTGNSLRITLNPKTTVYSQLCNFLFNSCAGGFGATKVYILKAIHPRCVVGNKQTP